MTAIKPIHARGETERRIIKMSGERVSGFFSTLGMIALWRDRFCVNQLINTMD